jgi:hypothetical protein
LALGDQVLWLQRHAWWGLLAIAATGVLRGLIDLTSGVTYQAEDLTGKTFAQITAESGAGSRLSDFTVRTDGLYLIGLGVVAGAILLFGFRQDHRWAWWASWAFPVMAIAGSVLDLGFGVEGPGTSSAIVGGLGVAILLLSAPRFFRQHRSL